MNNANSEIAVRNSPADLIREAAAGKLDIAAVKDLLQLQFAWEANEARKAYHKAMAAFKADPPQIVKDKTVGYQAKGQLVGYKHASLGNVCDKINAGLSKYGLSSSWLTKQENGKIGVTTKITHENGHSEESTLWAGADDTGSKNSIQAIGSTITYLQRYGLLALTGLATEDQDDDGRAAQTEYIDEQQVIAINEYIQTLKPNMDKFYKFMGVDSVAAIPKADYQKAINLFKTQENLKK